MSELSHAELVEQAKYWENKANELEIRLNDLHDELDEFTASSKDLESELEAQLNQADRRNKELLQLLEKSGQEVETLKRQLDTKNHDIHKLQEDSNALRKDLEDKSRRLRQMEQLNDDLERKTRITLTSLSEFEHSLNEAIEKNVFLQSEKEELLEAAQRWRDESRDLHQEVAVQRLRIVNFPSATSPQSEPNSESQFSATVGTQTETPLAAPNNSLPRSGIPLSRSMGFTEVAGKGTGPGVNGLVVVNGTPGGGGGGRDSEYPATMMTPSLRINALNAVGNLMRTVGALESRLAFIMNSQYHHTSNEATPGVTSVVIPDAKLIPHAQPGKTPLSGIPPPRITAPSGPPHHRTPGVSTPTSAHPPPISTQLQFANTRRPAPRI